MALSIRESCAKRLLRNNGDLADLCVCVDQDVDLGALTDEEPWLLTTPLVVKPDVLLKRRGKSGLVKLNVSWGDARTFLQENLNKTLTVDKLTGVLSHFIVEPFFPHDDTNNEYYVAMRTLREADEILFCAKGGVSVGDVENNAKKVQVPVMADGSIPKVAFGDMFSDVADEVARVALENFVHRLYEAFCRLNFAFLEINPLSYDSQAKKVKMLDCAAKLDHTAEFVCESLWGSVEFPSPFGRIFTDAEQYIRELDSKTGASLKLTIINPKARIWTMVAGGGASVIYADTISDLGVAHELANYGEYSGAPSEAITYEYAKTIIKLLTTEGTFREDGKLLLIGGGIANFTSVADTFKGIIRALRQFQLKLHEYKVRIYVRRGGPGYQDGLRLMREVAKELKLPIRVFGPETYMTGIIPLALEDDRRLKAGIGEADPKIMAHLGNGHSPTSKSNGLLTPPSVDHSRIVSWHETSLEDIEKDPNFQVMQVGFAGLPAEAGSRQLFTNETTSFVWGLQTRAVQEMLDFDHVCGRKKPSVAAIIYEFTASHVRPFYFGTEEIFMPVCQTLKEAVERFPEVDTLVNFASMRSADEVTRQAMSTESIRCIAVIAEGVPERKARELIQIAKQNDKVVIGPATVGGIRAGCFRIGNTGGKLENIMNVKLYRPGSVGIVTKSGGMLNEMNNIAATYADGTCEGVAIGGDRFSGTTMMTHLQRYEADSNIKVLALLGEVGGNIEYEVVRAMQSGIITKPIVAWCVGTCAPLFSTEVAFGHAGAWAGSESEHAAAKNDALRAAGARVPTSFQDFGETLRAVYNELVTAGVVKVMTEPDVPRVPMDYAWAKKMGLVRRPKGFVSTISDDRGEELVYAGWPISKVLQSGMGVGGVISLLWFKRPLPDYCYRYLESVLMLTADHGPAVCGAHNTIVTARAGKDLISSLISGLCCIGDRFGGACDQAAQMFLGAYDKHMPPEVFVREMRQKGKLIMGIGHKIKSVHNPDMRVQLLLKFCKQNFQKTTLIDFAVQVEKFTTKKKDTLILNVDGLIGVSMVDMLLGCGAFSDSEARDYIANGCINGLFVLGRSMGFIGHFLDQKRLKQGLYRHDVDDIAYVLPDLQR